MLLQDPMRAWWRNEFANDLIEGNADNAEHAFEICSRVNQALQTMSFFGGTKVVWLKAASFLGSDRTGESERAKSGVDGMLDVLEAGLPDEIIFILSATSIDKRRAFYKHLKQYAKLTTFDKPDPNSRDWQFEMGQSIKEKAKARRTVEDQDVELMIPLSRAGVIFEIGRALQKRNGARALELIDQQLERGESAIAVIRASLIPTLRNLFMARLVVDNFKPPLNNYNGFKATLDKFPSQDLAWLPKNKSGDISPYPLFLSAGDSKRFSAESLKKAMVAAHEVDRKLVTTGLDPRMLLHKLVVELCSSKLQSARA